MLLERETGLQRWAIKLELESSRQTAAAKTLQQQLQKVVLYLLLCLMFAAFLYHHVHLEQSSLPVVLLGEWKLVAPASRQICNCLLLPTVAYC